MKFPKIKSVNVISSYTLEIVFDNNVKKIYDCTTLLEDENFKPLLDKSLFKNVQVDNFGYGILWNNQIDLSESELWLNGQTV
jgi:hypothetical protein